MIYFNGKGVSSGYCIGPLQLIQEEKKSRKQGDFLSKEEHLALFQDAKERAVSDLLLLAEKLKNGGDETASLLMEAHSELAQDLDFQDAVVDKIMNENQEAQEAVLSAGEEFAMLFEDMDSVEMQARAADVRDVAQRIAHFICPQDQVEILGEPVIIVAEDISPSFVASVDKNKVLGIVTHKGSASGHAAILARCFGIPMVAGVEALFSPQYHQRCAILDGENGKVILEPDVDTKEFYQGLIQHAQSEKTDLEKFRGKPNKTSSGHEIKLYCNVQSPDEIQTVIDADANGIGLFRSEFLFLGRDYPPSEEEQFEVYAQILQKMNGNEVIIRTMDLGADKEVSYFGNVKEENPALGIRGIRLCFKNIEIFKTQLRALFRASVYGNLLIMFPMISDLWEIQKIKEICQEVRQELLSEKIPVASYIPIGIMIETPAAALISDVLAKEVDFFSCGTNDLVQYTLACDRMGVDTSGYYNAKHLAVKRLLEMTIQNAHAAGIWVGVCGEMASDSSFTEQLVLMGVDELSVTPGQVLTIRKKISEIKD